MFHQPQEKQKKSFVAAEMMQCKLLLLHRGDA
jgi:hypothetical protein